MQRGCWAKRLASCGLLAGLALGANGCAAVLIGGAVAAGGAAAGYAYYKGDVYFDFAAPFHPTWTAASAALQDLGLPVVNYSLQADHGEIQSRTPEDESVTLYIEPATAAGAAVTRVHIRVGIFGNQTLSERIHAQISNRLQVPAPVPLGAPVGPPPAAALQKETAPPPLADTPGQVVPVSTTDHTSPTAAGAKAGAK